MKEEEIVIRVCEILGVRYSHYDNHDMSVNYFSDYTLHSKPKIVVYGSKYSSWQFAILEDMSIYTYTGRISKMSIDIWSKIKELGTDLESIEESKGIISRAERELEKIEEAEKFLKENNCASVINNSDKKINWC